MGKDRGRTGGGWFGGGDGGADAAGSWKPSSNSPKSSPSAPSSKSSKSSPKSSASSPPSKSALRGPGEKACGLLLERAVWGVFKAGDIGESTDRQPDCNFALREDNYYTSVPVVEPSGLPSAAFNTRSGGGSDRCFFSGCVSEPAVSSVSSTTVLGMGCPPGGGDATASSRGAALSGMTAISSGSASPSLLRYASVPGTSPYEGSLLTFSTRVLGIGEFLCDSEGADWASEKWSSDSEESTGR